MRTTTSTTTTSTRQHDRQTEEEAANGHATGSDALSEETKRNSEPENNKENAQQSDGNGGQNGENKDEEQQSGPPEAVGFWDPRLKHVRHEAFTKWTITTAVLMTFILAVLSIYWAALYRVEQNLSNLVVYVVDFDGRVAPYDTDGFQPVVGPAITNLARSMVASKTPTLGFGVLPPSDFGNDPIQVRQAVFDFDAWAAIIINPNATSMLYSAIQNGNTSYDPLGACQLVYIDSRDDTNWYDFMLPIMSSFMTEATTMVGEQWTRMVMENATTNATLVRNAARVPQALSPAIGFSQFNLRPFYPYQVIPSISIGLIYLIIISFFSFAFYLPIHFKVRINKSFADLVNPLLT